jgi:hypothetical protein
VRERSALRAAWAIGALVPLRAWLRPPAAEADPDAPATILTCVAPLPGPLAAALRRLTLDLETLEPGHHYYPPESMHLTIAHSPPPGGGFTDMGRAETDWGEAAGDVEEAARTIAGARVRVIGLGLGPSTVYALLAADDDRLARGRAWLRRRWTRRRVAAARDLLATLLLHVTIVRLGERPSAAFVGLLRSRRALRSDAHRLTCLQFVRTNKVLSRDRTTTLIEVPLEAME